MEHQTLINLDLDSRYRISKTIGKGIYGNVSIARDFLMNRNIAIKMIPKAFDDLNDAKRTAREVKLLSLLNHDNVVKLYDIKLGNYNNDVYLITELMESNLHKTIYSKQQLTDEHTQYFMYQLIRGLCYLHSAKVIHRDIKPENLLVNSDCDLKICDFGLARNSAAANLTKEVVSL